ncbi:MAG TPA: CHAD domain-containing protein [Acidobacteriota bacterium]|nr:CHAD domain-containing protein [Acidobacteriota bacterium]
MRPEELDDVFAGIALRKRADALLLELRGLKRRPHQDSIHDTRVQSRRMRASLEAFQDLFPPLAWRTVYDQVRSITRNLGKARETEVSLSLLDHLSTSGDLPEKICAEHLEERLRRRLSKCHKRLKKCLGRIDLRSLRSSLEHLLSELGKRDESDPATGIVVSIRSGRIPKAHSRAGTGTRQPFLFPLRGETVARTRRVLAELAAPLLAFRPRADFRRSSDTRLHRLRISAKRLRYAMEIFDEAFPGGLKEQIELARLLQEAGGHHQDWAVLRWRLEKDIHRLKRQGASQLALQADRILAEAENRKTVSRKEILPALIRLQASLRELLQNPPYAGQTDSDREANVRS